MLFPQEKATLHDAVFYLSWVSAALALILFRPLGIFLVVFSIFVSYKEGKRARAGMSETNADLQEAHAKLPQW